MDGCSPWRIYWNIMLPLSLPALATAAIFTFICTWDDFFGAAGLPQRHADTYTVQTRRCAAFLEFQRPIRLGRACSPCRC